MTPDMLLLENEVTSESLVQDSFNLKLINNDLQAALSVAHQQFHATPLFFQSPELLNNTDGKPKLTEKQDVWAFGVLLAILLTGESPHKVDGSSNLLLKAIVEGSFDFES